nr:thiamine phosphate synthase [Ardenticatena sp.]
MPDWRLYVITDPRYGRGGALLEKVAAAIRGGATIVQLRDKQATTRTLIEQARALLTITRPAGVPLIINDRVDVALAVGADGVHLGVDDMPIADARRLLGPHAIIGGSPETIEDALRMQQEGATYLGVGDVFGTPTKPDAGTPIGIEGVQRIIAQVAIPVVGIGGITIANAADVIRAGAAGIAVVSAVMGAQNPEAAARHLRRIISQARQEAQP